MSVSDGLQASNPTSKQLLAVACEAAEQAAMVIRRQSAGASSLRWSEKGTADFVTEVDREAERVITSAVVNSLPLAGVMGEELAPDRDITSGTWFIVDPIDGTTNFMHGYPEYAVSIGVMQNSELSAAVILNVPRGELFTATAGGGAFRDGKPIRVSKITWAMGALVGTGFPFKHREYFPRYLRQMERVIASTAGIRRAGSAALDLAHVACGRFDAFWELQLAPWDVAAGLLLVREAGGVVTDLNGRHSVPAHAPIVAGNPAMHDWLIKVLRDTDAGHAAEAPR